LQVVSVDVANFIKKEKSENKGNFLNTKLKGGKVDIFKIDYKIRKLLNAKKRRFQTSFQNLNFYN